MITWRAVGSAGGNPNLAARSMIGSTVPRKLTTPRTKLGDFGKAVAFVQPRISRTDMMSTQNSWAPIRKAMSSRARVKSLVLLELAPMMSVMSLACCCKNPFVSSRSFLRTSDDRIDIEDQGNPAVAKDGRCGDALNMPVIGFKALDDDLTLTQNRINQESASCMSFGLNEKNNAFGWISMDSAVTKGTSDIDEGDELITDRDHFCIAAKAMNRGTLRLQSLDDGGQRNDQGLTRDGHDHPIEHSKGQRQAHGEGRALPRARTN